MSQKPAPTEGQSSEQTASLATSDDAACYAWVAVCDDGWEEMDDPPACRRPPEGSLCVVDFGPHHGDAEYFLTYDKEEGCGLGCRYYVAEFLGDKYRIESVGYECGMTGEKIELGFWEAERFFVLQHNVQVDLPPKEGGDSTRDVTGG